MAPEQPADFIERGTGGEHVVDQGDGYARLSATLARDADPRDELSRALRERGVAIRELLVEQARLEDYFQQITEGAEAEVPRNTSSIKGKAYSLRRARGR